MGIGIKTHKLLWGRSGNKCAFEGCKIDLIADETETDDESIIGDEAHIIAKSMEGPRGDSSLHIGERDKYDNLILLCRKHHKIIDDQYNFYTVEKLKKMKLDHEKWVKSSLEIDKERNKIDLAYASYIDEIVMLLDFENWSSWILRVLEDASISHKSYRRLKRLPEYIAGRFWSNDYVDLEDAVYNIQAIVSDFMTVFNRHIDSQSFYIEDDNNLEKKIIYTEPFYKLEWHLDQKIYDKLLDQYKFHVALIYDLMVELTKAANLLIEKIRKYIYPHYREEEGKLLIRTDSYNSEVLKLEYNPKEKREKYRYNGLKDFMATREKRDQYIGKGISDKYLRFNY